ncbi:hypothetical protein ABB27_17410 [Stenotrophomonas terrae]|uniref:Uncharacterized protein n=1 Tax=Stenotrophomonas terrae TaxID=405446 RepID=A0A0R0C2Y1_9GAMM|nr:hypothetical protein [Stenotrophomonas terrae]KRG63654.1 hypothetical protein ABB27_17410 [Stenotrophomonas terrae]
MIDWPNVMATLCAALIGGLVATKVAKGQVQAMLQAEREKSQKETALELLESIDSFVHIAYRGGDEQSRLERQRLRRRMLSLTVLTVPNRFTDLQSHLDGVDRWWFRKNNGGTQKIADVGYTATNDFFERLKTDLFCEVFGQKISFSDVNEPAN